MVGKSWSQVLPSHWIVDGCSSEEVCGAFRADDGKIPHCRADHETQAPNAGTTWVRDAFVASIGVQCCALDGLSAERPGGCVENVTFAEAEDVCASEGMRLCTKAEVLTDIGHSSKDCWDFDKLHVWTSTSCIQPPLANGNKQWTSGKFAMLNVDMGLLKDLDPADVGTTSCSSDLANCADNPVAADIVREFASDEQAWLDSFAVAFKTMITAGYTEDELLCVGSTGACQGFGATGASSLLASNQSQIFTTRRLRIEQICD